jgi:hypothetical protein
MALPILRKRTILDIPGHPDVEIRHGKHVIPSGGDVTLRCGKCGSTDFTAHVRPQSMGAARITTLVCNLCAKRFPFNDQGETGGSMTVEQTNGYRHREAINARSDD